jgi:energy-coupling factor transport system ATP-binding protein
MEEGRIRAAGPPRQVLREHGQYMVDSLGVWLPETSEIGIELQTAGLLDDEPIPITIAETLDLLGKKNLLKGELAGSAIVAASPATSGGDVLVSAQELHYAYPGGLEALRGISLDIRAGEWLMIVGRNGAGKSTLARLLVGLNKPRSGALTLFGKDAQRWKVSELANHIALVFQNPEHQFLTDSVSDEIGYSLLAQGISDPAEKERRTRRLLHQLGLEDFTDIHPFALSAGLKRRLGVATMLVGDPQVLLVDEPTYGQDKEKTHTLMALMREIRAQGVAVVMITHDMRLVQEYAERVVVMSEGRILYDGPSSGLFDRDELLAQANLRRTILHDLLGAMSRQGTTVHADIRRTSDLVALLKAGCTAG